MTWGPGTTEIWGTPLVTRYWKGTRHLLLLTPYISKNIGGGACAPRPTYSAVPEPLIPLTLRIHTLIPIPWIHTLMPVEVYFILLTIISTKGTILVRTRMESMVREKKLTILLHDIRFVLLFYVAYTLQNTTKYFEKVTKLHVELFRKKKALVKSTRKGVCTQERRLLRTKED